MERTATIAETIRSDRDEGARRLVAELRPWLLAEAMRLCGDRDEAESLVFRAFEQALRRIETYRDDRPFRPWLRAILVNFWRKDHRGAMDRATSLAGGCDDVEALAGAPADADPVREAVDGAIVRDALAALTPAARDVVVLHYFLGQGVASIAKFLAVSDGTVKSRLHYARLALAAKLGGGGDGGKAARAPGTKAILAAIALAAALAFGAVVAAVSGGAQDNAAESAVTSGGNGGPPGGRPLPVAMEEVAVGGNRLPSNAIESTAIGGNRRQSTTIASSQQPATTMKPRTFLSAALGLALGASASAETCRIEESDLLGGARPAALSFGADFGPIVKVGSPYSVSDFFDASKTSMFDIRSSSGNVEWYLEVAITNSCFFNTYSINVNKGSTASGNNRAPKSWEVWGATSDKAGWSLLTSESGQTGWDLVNGETRLYRFKNGGTRYKRLRFKFLETNGDKSYIHVSAIALYPPTSLATGATEETFAGCADLVPAPTAATASRYTTTAGTFFNSSFNAGSAFAAGSPSRMVFSLSSNDDTSPANIVYEFGADSPQVVNGYLVWMANHQYSGTGYAPRAWAFSGSDDGESWTLLDERSEQYGWALGQKRWFAFENHDAYAFYKIEFSGSNGGSRIEIGSLDWYHRPVEGVFFAEPSAEVAEDGSFVVSGALAADSLPADVMLRAATNGVPFEIALGAKQPGESFSVAVPGPGVLYATLAGASGSYTGERSLPLAWAPGDGAARFVSPEGDDDANDGLTPAAPLRRIAAAVASLGAAGGAVYVLPGDYAETNDLSAVSLAAPTAVVGVSGDPADARVTQDAPCGWARVFKLAHKDALVRSLTIHGGKVQNEISAANPGQTPAEANASLTASGNAAQGGNVWITAAGGTVENCMIRDGSVERFASAGGNVYLHGGRLSRCVLVGGKLSTNLSLTQGRPCGTSLYANGGVVENSLFTDTTQSVAPICVNGSATLLNCTVAGNAGKSCGGVVVMGTGAKVVNTVIFGNRHTESEGDDAWLPLTGVDAEAAAAAFARCAVDGAAPNATCRTVDATAFADAAGGDWSPASFESPLVNRGSDYAAAGGVSALDLAGNPRICTRRADIGAFEFQYENDPAFVLVVR